MKFEKFFLGILVLVFAISSAIASAFYPAQAHVRGKIDIITNTWACVPIDNPPNCDNTQGLFECVVRIRINGIYKNVLAYKGPGSVSPETECIFPLRQDMHQPVLSIPVTPILEIWYADLR